MKISESQLIKIIKESLEQARSEQAIDHAQSSREDGLSFEDFTEAILMYLEERTDQQWDEESLSDDWNYYDEWLKGTDPYSIGAEYLADVYLQENKMKISQSQLIKITKEELRKFLKENHPALGKNPPHDIPADDPELTADQLASLEEPIDATADMSDEEVEKLAAALAAAAQSMDSESYEWYPDEDEW